MDRPKIVVTGANGQLAREIRVLAGQYAAFDFIFLSRQQLPIQDESLVMEFFGRLQPQYCINCAAYTAVDKAETDSDMAFLINGSGTGILAAVCNLHNTRFIHLSTDYVFKGIGDTPYIEPDPVDPVNKYGASKRKGEELALQANQQTIIIRTSWVYSVFGNNFVKTMIRLMKERTSLNVVNDQQGSPTYAADLAAVILNIIAVGKWIPGIYHYSNEGTITWYQFALAIKEMTGSVCHVHPVSTSEFPTPAQRPAYAVLNKKKIQSVYGITIPDWKNSLQKCINLIS